MDWTALVAPAANLLDSLIYTDQERAADALRAQTADAIQAQSRAQIASATAAAAVAQQQAQTMKFVAILGAGVVGVGLLVWSARA